MKKLIVLLIALAMSTSAYAATGGAQNWSSQAAKNIDDLINHTHEVKVEDAAGLGADIVVFESESIIEEVVIEYRRDFKGDANTVYGVARVNLWSKIKGLFNK